MQNGAKNIIDKEKRMKLKWNLYIRKALFRFVHNRNTIKKEHRSRSNTFEMFWLCHWKDKFAFI